MTEFRDYTREKGGLTMAEYIEREELMKYPIVYGIESILEYAQDLPAADVAPVVHGHWLKVENDEYYDGCLEEYHVCSNCGEGAITTSHVEYDDIYDLDENPVDSWHEEYVEILTNYCPNCGAKMDEEENDNENK